MSTFSTQGFRKRTLDVTLAALQAVAVTTTANLTVAVLDKNEIPVFALIKGATVVAGNSVASAAVSIRNGANTALASGTHNALDAAHVSFIPLGIVDDFTDPALGMTVKVRLTSDVNVSTLTTGAFTVELYTIPA